MSEILFVILTYMYVINPPAAKTRICRDSWINTMADDILNLDFLCWQAIGNDALNMQNKTGPFMRVY